MEETAPWRLAKDPSSQERLESVLYNVLESLRHIAIHLTPFLPDASARLLAQLGAAVTNVPATPQWGGLVTGGLLPAGPVLFPKIEEDVAQ